MKKKVILALIVCVLFSTALFANGAQQGQTQAAGGRVWPNFRTIDIVTGCRNTTGTDAVIRVFLNYLTKRFPDVNFILTNDSGGNGTVAYEKIRHGKPDGSMIYMDSPNMIANYAFGLYEHSLDEFEIIHDLRIPVEYSAIAVLPDSKYKTLQELVDDAKARPNMVSSPIGVGQVLARAIGMERDLGGVTFRKVAATGNGNAERISSVLGGHSDFIFVTLAQLEPYVQGGQLRYLGYYGNERSKLAPDVPCFKELGFPVQSPDVEGHYPILAPKGLSEDIANAIRDLLRDCAADEASRELFFRLEKGYPLFISKEEARQQLFDVQDFYLMGAGKKEWNF